MNTIKTLPCPKCGYPHTRLCTVVGTVTRHWVECSRCAHDPGRTSETKDGAADAWNTAIRMAKIDQPPSDTLKVQEIRDICAKLEDSRVKVTNGESWAVFPASVIDAAMKEADDLIAESERRLQQTIRELERWRAAAQAATPGGSDYADPAFTEAYLHQMKRNLHEARKAIARLKKVAK